MRSRTSASHACGSMPFILAVTMRLYRVAARWSPRTGQIDPKLTFNRCRQNVRVARNGAASATAGTMLRDDGLLARRTANRSSASQPTEGRYRRLNREFLADHEDFGPSCDFRYYRASRSVIIVHRRCSDEPAFGEYQLYWILRGWAKAAAIMLTFRPARLLAPVPQVQPST